MIFSGECVLWGERGLRMNTDPNCIHHIFCFSENRSDKNIIIIVLGIIAAIMTLLFFVFCILYFKTRGKI